MGDSMNKTILIMNGLSLDKAVFNDVLKRVANDRHIWYARDKIRQNYGDKKLLNRAKQISFFADLVGMHPGINVCSLLKYPADKTIDYIGKKLPEHAGKINPKYKNNFDYWNLFLSNISDTQTLISYMEPNTKIKQVFSGRPYYENKYIDSLFIEIKLNDNIDENKIKNLIIKHVEYIFYAEYICETLEQSFAEHSIIKKIKSVLSERGAFGIYFLSGFFNELYGDEEINFEFSTNLIDSTKGLNEEGAFIRELVLLAGNPGKINFHCEKKSSSDNIIRLIKIDNEVSQLNSNKSLKQLFYNKKTKDGFLKLLLPIKRVISLPYSSLEAIKKMGKIPLAFEKDVHPLPEIFKEDDLQIISVGGGEHNLPLVHLVNVIRHKDMEERRFGFLENAFDRNLRGDKNAFPEFMICLEKFVSGINSLARGREIIDSSPLPMITEAQSNEAEILKIDFNEKIGGFAVYGFSAPMTRYAFLALIYALDEENDNLFKDDKKHKYQRNEYINFTKSKSSVFYLGEDEDSFIKLRNEFDNLDIMNNSEKKEIKIKIIENMFMRSRN